MARKINEQDFSRMMEYLTQKVRNHVDEIEIEGSSKDCVVVFTVKTFREKLTRADEKQLNKWFRICENAVHLRVMDFKASSRIEVKQFLAGGKLQDRPLRTGDWREGEKQKAEAANEGRYNGEGGKHWFDYSYINAEGKRVRVEVKHAGAWMEPNREGR